MDGELIRHQGGFVSSYSYSHVDGNSYTCSYRNADTDDCFLQLERYVGYGMGHDGAGSNGE